MKKIDIFTHIIPPKYKQALYELTDSQLYDETGDRFTREVTGAVGSLDITPEEKEMIYHGNAEKLLRLDPR